MKWGAGLCRFFVGFVAMVRVRRKVRTKIRGKKNRRSWVTRASGGHPRVVPANISCCVKPQDRVG